MDELRPFIHTVEQCPHCGGMHIALCFFESPAPIVICGSVYRFYGLCGSSGLFLFVTDFEESDRTVLEDPEYGTQEHGQDYR
jgi:hypothetical protein